MNKAKLCEVIPKKLFYGSKYGKESVKYFETKEGRVFQTAMMLGINPDQPFDRILDELGLN